MGRIKLWLADIRPLADCEQAALSLLSPGRRVEAERFRPREDRLHCIAAGLLLRQVLGVRSDDDLCCNEFGKPLLVGQETCFNLSHGGNYAVLAVFHSPVGVDIEPIGERMPRVIPRRFLLPNELAWLEAEPTPERFARLWTRLESALKADGRGFGLGKRDFSVMDGGPWQIQTLPFDGHMISCAAGEPFELHTNCLTARELLAE